MTVPISSLRLMRVWASFPSCISIEKRSKHEQDAEKSNYRLKFPMDVSDELSQLAADAGRAVEELRASGLKKSLEKLRLAAQAAGRAWSGSNLGYHSTVYYTGLQPKPASVQFSSEWGLLDRWPTHSPAPGWQIMDRQQVIDQIVSKAGGCDSQKLDAELKPFRDGFATMRENAISALSAAVSRTNDEFLSRKLSEVSKLKVLAASVVARELIPNGSHWTRDSLALSQGLQVAPHQSLLALPLSADTIDTALDQLEKATRVSAAHLRRINSSGQQTKTKSMTIFIGHGQSPIWRELKDFVVDRLHLNVDEFNRVPTAGIPTTSRLLEMLESAAFAFIVMTAEDERSDGKFNARLNVVHEAGLFQGRLGFKKAIILLEEGCEEFSNIKGLGQIRFPQGNVSAKFEEIRAVLEREAVL